MTISEHLTTYPQTKRQLAEKSGYSVRDVELLIHAARLEGVPILSDGDGYRMAQNAAEVRQCADRLRQRAIHQLLTARALKKASKRMAVAESVPLSFPWKEAA